ncbi:MAG: hypothetical protein KDC79_07270 [Cyclobacteriaceae bacterium]|nr:hypothetical protein [Cyclobacteriaceae bacterium]
MDEFFQFIGSIASLISIPLAIFLFLKSKEGQFDKIKKEIIKILSHQIGEERKVSSFEIESVINSKLREARMKTDSLTVEEIVEDLVSETISSPLIDKARKDEILKDLKAIIMREDFSIKIEELLIKKENDSKIKWNNVEPKIRQLYERELEHREAITGLKEKTDKYRQSMSNIFALSALLITSITLIIGMLGEDKIKELTMPLDTFTQKYEFAISLIAGIITSVLAGASTFIFRKKIKKLN